MISFDSKCHELAVFFIEDEPGIKFSCADELAARIQQTIEDFIAEKKPAPGPSLLPCHATGFDGQNMCARDKGHAGEHRCSAGDVDDRAQRATRARR